ncbi:MAG: trigger factor [Gaiellales bacterium]
MQTAVETLEDDKVRIRVEIDAHDVDHAFEHALSDLAKDVRVPGFRKGKAPVAVIRQRLGEEAVRDEALRSHINGWWRRATAAAGVDGIGQPEIDWDEPIEPGAPFTFTGVVQVPPKAVLPAGLTLAAVKPEGSVDDDYVDQEIERIRAAGATFEAAATAVESGHQVLVDMHGTVDGNAIKDAQATDLLVEAGAGRLLDELDEALIGMQAGDVKEVAVQLPKEQKPKKLAGREAVFAVTVKEVRVRVLPDLDDEFAKQVAGFDTLQELKDDIRQGREQNLEREADGQFRRNVLQDLGAQAEVEVPPAMVGRRIDDRLQAMARSLGQQGIDLEQYMGMMGRDLNGLAMELAPECEREVREELALDAYVELHGISVPDDELRAFIAEQAAAENEADEVVDRIMDDAAMREDVRRDLVLKTALDRAVAEAAVITPEEAEARANARAGSDEGATAEQNAGEGDDASSDSEQES